MRQKRTFGVAAYVFQSTHGGFNLGFEPRHRWGDTETFVSNSLRDAQQIVVMPRLGAQAANLLQHDDLRSCSSIKLAVGSHVTGKEHGGSDHIGSGYGLQTLPPSFFD